MSCFRKQTEWREWFCRRDIDLSIIEVESKYAAAMLPACRGDVYRTGRPERLSQEEFIVPDEFSPNAGQREGTQELHFAYSKGFRISNLLQKRPGVKKEDKSGGSNSASSENENNPSANHGEEETGPLNAPFHGIQSRRFLALSPA